MSSKCLLYADDAKIFKAIFPDYPWEDIELQNDIYNIQKWCTKWRMTISETKTTKLTYSKLVNQMENVKSSINSAYSLNNIKIQEVSYTKDLGCSLMPI